MTTEKRISKLLTATPEQLEHIDAILDGTAQKEAPASLKLLGMGKAADEMGISRSTLWRMIRQGSIRAVKLCEGGRSRVPESEVRRFVSGRVA